MCLQKAAGFQGTWANCRAWLGYAVGCPLPLEALPVCMQPLLVATGTTWATCRRDADKVPCFRIHGLPDHAAHLTCLRYEK